MSRTSSHSSRGCFAPVVLFHCGTKIYVNDVGFLKDVLLSLGFAWCDYSDVSSRVSPSFSIDDGYNADSHRAAQLFGIFDVSASIGSQTVNVPNGVGVASRSEVASCVVATQTGDVNACTVDAHAQTVQAKVYIRFGLCVVAAKTDALDVHVSVVESDVQCGESGEILDRFKEQAAHLYQRLELREKGRDSLQSGPVEKTSALSVGASAVSELSARISALGSDVASSPTCCARIACWADVDTDVVYLLPALTMHPLRL
eukprot:TRINITY_DN105884_c0_g1_i1.p1 TRINITY_DN105884_c0_g1~~TRINITY_DN105884_c0_g1_i1.p1  ORF type:complete len:258 (-),score=12.43 TRINITY_DN105884_c0_g1_i1:712-1485(-)